MQVTLYDFNDDPTVVDIPDDWKLIIVRIISGDEVIDVVTEDKVYTYDSSSTRIMDFYDEQYVITPNEFAKWCERTSSDCHSANGYKVCY